MLHFSSFLSRSAHSLFTRTQKPLLGEYTWGYLGDVIDGMSIVVTIGGICTSLGLGAIQMAAGAQRVGWLGEGLSEDETTNAQIVIIWLITIMTTASVLVGLSLGIRYLSLLGECNRRQTPSSRGPGISPNLYCMKAFGLGIMLTLVVFMMDHTAYLMNLTVQTLGNYIQYALLQLPFHTDAFGQLSSGEGRAVDGHASATWWFDAWTVFYVSKKKGQLVSMHFVSYLFFCLQTQWK